MLYTAASWQLGSLAGQPHENATHAAPAYSNLPLFHDSTFQVPVIEHVELSAICAVHKIMMPFDPFTALSLAAEPVQFVDFSIKIVSKGYAFTKSANDELMEHVEMGAKAQRLRDITRRIDGILLAAPGSDADLKAICNGCRQVSEELSKELEKLKLRPGFKNTLWKSFRHGLKTVCAKSKLEAINRRLAELRQELTVHMLDHISIALRFVPILV